MKIVFRVDASLLMGTGHVMRCLTLAQQFQMLGTHQIVFICREHTGHLIDYIEQLGFTAYRLPQNSIPAPSIQNIPFRLAHSHWLGATQSEDASLTAAILETLQPDWLVVDHYALDAEWELKLANHTQRLMVIDDLADRQHQCDVLLDQTFGRLAADYESKVPSNCRLLLGTDFALLRAEFALQRSALPKPRKFEGVHHLLITMGGVDVDNVSGDILTILNQASGLNLQKITLVLGSSAPHVQTLVKQSADMKVPTRILQNAQNMAELMSQCDLAIGAAGSTAWERCCLGLPTVMVVLADNQQTIAKTLVAQNAAWVLDKNELLSLAVLLNSISAQQLQNVSQNAMNVVDGLGAERVAKWLLS